MKSPGVQKLLDVLKAVDDSPTSMMGFDMSKWFQARHASKHPCGTACCIGGWANYCLQKETHDEFYDGQLAVIRFCELLPSPIEVHVDFDRVFSVVDELCHAYILTEQISSLRELTLPMAIRVLEIFRDTGEVKWAKVYEEMKGDDANVPSVS